MDWQVTFEFMNKFYCSILVFSIFYMGCSHTYIKNHSALNIAQNPEFENCVYRVKTKKQCVSLVYYAEEQNSPQFFERLSFKVINLGDPIRIIRGFDLSTIQLTTGAVKTFKVSSDKSGFSVCATNEGGSIIELEVSVSGTGLPCGTLLEIYSESL